jgi:hypothetical protein
MGKRRKDALRFDFDRKLKAEFHGTKVDALGRGMVDLLEGK